MKKVLVCDDAEEILEVINIILSEGNYEVLTLSDSKDIVEKIKDFTPDVILLDLWIHNSDGRDIAKEIRSVEEISDIPILFISALNELDKIASEAHVDGYIKKPFELDDLLNKVEETIAANEESVLNQAA